MELDILFLCKQPLIVTSFARGGPVYTEDTLLLLPLSAHTPTCLQRVDLIHTHTQAHTHTLTHTLTHSHTHWLRRTPQTESKPAAFGCLRITVKILCFALRALP